MQIYVLIACDRLEESQEKNLKQNLTDILAALQRYVDENTVAHVSLINECDSDSDSDNCEDWQLGIAQTVKKSVQLKFPMNLFNYLAKQFSLDCEIGSIEDDSRVPVSYFGHEEGKGDSYLIAQYLGL
jgi:hypothetical protein